MVLGLFAYQSHSKRQLMYCFPSLLPWHNIYLVLVRYAKHGAVLIGGRYLCLVILLFVCLIILTFEERVIMYYFDSAVSSLGLLLNSEVLISLPFISILKHLFVWL